MPLDVPAATSSYLGRLTQILQARLGDDLVAAYVHGSAVLGGFQAGRSDVDVLVIVRAQIGRERLEALADAVRDASLELDVITLASAERPQHPAPFELNVSASGTSLGEDHGPYGDGILHLAVARAAGFALAGPPPGEVIGEVPREWLLGEFQSELDWALEHAPTAYQALNAARGWRFASEGVICSKLKGAQWAMGRGYDDVLRDAVAYQEGDDSRAPDAAAAAQIVARAQQALAHG